MQHDHNTQSQHILTVSTSFRPPWSQNCLRPIAQNGISFISAASASLLYTISFDTIFRAEQQITRLIERVLHEFLFDMYIVLAGHCLWIAYKTTPSTRPQQQSNPARTSITHHKIWPKSSRSAYIYTCVASPRGATERTRVINEWILGLPRFERCASSSSARPTRRIVHKLRDCSVCYERSSRMELMLLLIVLVPDTATCIVVSTAPSHT